MADQEQPQQSQLAAAFPNPPPFWRDFTPANIERIEKLHDAIPALGNDDPLTRRIPGVPQELINLQPPAEPADGKWRVFGDQYKVCS